MVGICYANSMKNISRLASELSNQYLLKPAEKATTFYWSPAEKTVYYNPENNTEEGVWALLHESGHAILNHMVYSIDIELVKMEVQAWEKAKSIGKDLAVVIDENHIQDCLDSYRSWLHKRSLCPDCHLSGIQISKTIYTCIFCNTKWSVTAERFCRPYRRRSIL